MTVWEVTVFFEISPAARKLAAILQFGTSYELVDWLAKRLTEVVEWLAQEHKDRVMIQKSLSGVLEPEEQAEVDKIGRKRHAKSRGEAIQMPPLHEALVEVHREYERASKAARDMAERYNNASAAVDDLHAQCAREQDENKRMKEVILQQETQGRPSISDPELQQKLTETEKAKQNEETRADKAESRNRELEAQLQSAKAEAAKCLEEKDMLIQDLQRQLAQQQEDTKQYVEQVDELEEYVISQETCYTTQLAGRDQIIEEGNSKIVQLQEDWNTEKAELQRQCEEIRKISEQRRLDLYVAEAKLMQAKGGSQAMILDLRKRLGAAQFDASMTKDKVQAIV